MTPRGGLHVALAGVVIAVLGAVALGFVDASGQPKPSVERTLLGLPSVSGLIIMIGGLIVHGHFLGRMFAILVGAFVAFGIGATFGFLITKGSEEVPAALGSLAAIGWLILASILWGKIRKAK